MVPPERPSSPTISSSRAGDDDGRTSAWSFAFERPLDTWARWFAVLPTRSYVRVDDHGFEAVYGLWRVATVWSNVAGVERTGPYRAWKVGGPARVSVADRGITMAATTAGGACLRFREPVRGIDPLGVIRHPSITLGVDDLEAFLSIVRERIDAAGEVPPGSPPDHRDGRYSAALRAIWHWNRRDVDHRQRPVGDVAWPAVDRAGDDDDQPVEVAVGPTFHRRYCVAVRAGAAEAEAVMAAIQADPDLITDVRLAPFTKVRGLSGAMRVGDRYVIGIAGPWTGAVEVVAVSPTSLRLATLEGHMESGVIEMRTAVQTGDDGQDHVEFTIESWARSHDRFLDLMYDKLGIAKALQSEMWAVACDRFVELVQAETVRPLTVTTERAG